MVVVVHSKIGPFHYSCANHKLQRDYFNLDISLVGHKNSQWSNLFRYVTLSDYFITSNDDYGEGKDINRINYTIPQ